MSNTRRRSARHLYVDTENLSICMNFLFITVGFHNRFIIVIDIACSLNKQIVAINISEIQLEIIGIVFSFQRARELRVEINLNSL